MAAISSRSGALWGDIIASGYKSGRELGDDFASMKYRRAESAEMERVKAEAAAAKMPLADYLNQTLDPVTGQTRYQQVESNLSDAYRTTGGLRRGTLGDDKKALDTGAIGRLKDTFSTDAGRVASRSINAGDYQSGYGTMANSAATLGDLASVDKFGTARDKAALGTASWVEGQNGEAGKFDAGKYQTGLSKMEAIRGDGAGAQTANESADKYRSTVTAQSANELAMMLATPSTRAQYKDRIRGVFETLKGVNPKMIGDMDVQVDDKGMVTIYRGGAAVGTLGDGTNDEAELEDVRANLYRISQDPAGHLQGIYDQRAEAAKEADKRAWEMSQKWVESRSKIIEGAKLPAAAIQDAVNYADVYSKLKTGGWTNISTGEDGSVTGTIGGQIIRITGGSAGGIKYVDGKAMPDTPRIITLDGKEITQADLAKLDQTGDVVALQAAANAARAKGASAQNFALLDQQLALTDATFAPFVPGAATSLGNRSSSGVGSGSGSAAIPKTEQAAAVKAAADKYGFNPVWMAAIIGFESGHRIDAVNPNGINTGLIQFGNAEKKKYGINTSTPYAEQAMKAAQFLYDRGYRPDMPFEQMYSTVNAGSPGLLHRKDGDTTVSQKVGGAAMAKAMAQAEAMFSGTGEGVPAPAISGPSTATAAADTAAPTASPVKPAAKAKPSRARATAADIPKIDAQLTTAVSDVKKWEKELADFDRSKGSGARRDVPVRAGFGLGAPGPGVQVSQLSAKDKAVRDRIASKLRRATAARDSLTASLNRAAQEVREDTAKSLSDREFAAIESRVKKSK